MNAVKVKRIACQACMHADHMDYAFVAEMEKQNTLPHMYTNSQFLNQTGNDSQINTSLAMLPQSRPQPQAILAEQVAVQVGCLK